MIYPLIIIILLTFAAWRGWERGMLNQIASLLGLAFGFVTARLFYEPMSEVIDPMFPGPETFADEPFGTPLRRYTLYIVSASAVFIITYMVFTLIGSVLSRAMQLIHTGAVNSILGAALCFCKWLVLLSIILNLMLVAKPEGALAKYCNDGDGNVVELVMNVAPALFNTESPAELNHYKRLQQAKQLEQS